MVGSVHEVVRYTEIHISKITVSGDWLVPDITALTVLVFHITTICFSKISLFSFHLCHGFFLEVQVSTYYFFCLEVLTVVLMKI